MRMINDSGGSDALSCSLSSDLIAGPAAASATARFDWHYIKCTVDPLYSLSLSLRRGYLNIYYHCLHKYIVIDNVGVIYEGSAGTPAAALLMERYCDNDCTERSIISRSAFARALLHGYGRMLFPGVMAITVYQLLESCWYEVSKRVCAASGLPFSTTTLINGITNSTAVLIEIGYLFNEYIYKTITYTFQLWKTSTIIKYITTIP